MTDWNQIRTISDWHNDTTPEGAGTASYNAGNESWDLEAGKAHYFVERGGWVDGYRPKSMRVSFTGGSVMALYVYRKVWNGSVWYPTTVVSNKPIQSGQQVSLDGLTTDLMEIVLYSYEDETPTVINIAFSDEEYTEPSLEQETWSNVNWSGYDWDPQALNEEVYSVLMEVASGIPYFIISTRYSIPYVYRTWGVKYDRNDWSYISKNEVDGDTSDELTRLIDTQTLTEANGMTVMSNGVVNTYYRRTGTYYGIEVNQNYNVEGPPIRLGQTTVALDYGWAQWSNLSATVQAEYNSIIHTNMGNIIIPFTADSKSQIWYMQHYWNDPFTSNWILGGNGTYANACMLLEDTDPSNEFRNVAMIGDTENILHLLYLHKEGTTQYIRHIKNVDGTWGSPITLYSYDKNLPFYQGQLMRDSQNNIHFFPVLGLSPRNVAEHWVYDGSSWSNERLPITSLPTDFCYDVVIDKRDNFHIVMGNDSGGIDRISNESGSWVRTTIISNYSSLTTVGMSFGYDSDQDRLYYSIKDTVLNDIGFITFDLSALTYAPSVSSASSVSESSSSSADSKSSESSESSSESSSSRSQSSSSADSKSSTSSSSQSSLSSESSSSSSADSKSSSSSSHSSQSWDDPCVAKSGSFASWAGKNTNETDPSYNSDDDSFFGLGGSGVGSPAFNDPTQDWIWYEFSGLNFDGSQYVEVVLSQAKAAVAMRITGPDSQYQKGMTDFDIVGSNTGAFGGEEVVLIRVRGVTWSAPDQQISYNIKNNTDYLYYRVVPWGTQDTNNQYCRFEMIELFECYDDSSSSESSESSESSLSLSSTSIGSSSSESFDLVGWYELCENFNVSSSSSSRSESSISGQPDFVGPIEE